MRKPSAAEVLIAELMTGRGMTREEAVVAVVTEDQRERNAGREPLVGGEPLSILYADEIQGELTEAQAIRVVAYLKDLSEEEARADLMRKAASGTVFFETRH